MSAIVFVLVHNTISNPCIVLIILELEKKLY